VGDLQSKVTLRPRSKLERVLDVLTKDYDVPRASGTPLVAQLALYYLVPGEALPDDAARVISGLRDPSGAVNARTLATIQRDVVASLCNETKVDEVLAALHVLGKLAESNAFEALGQLELDEARRALGALPRLSAQQVDYLLLASRSFATVAPAPSAQRVVLRLGYPGRGYAALTRSLDAEIPEGDALELAWRAHHVLRAHGHEICAPVEPSCESCRIRGACAFRGEGEDPAQALGPDTAAPHSSVSRVSAKPTG
jgi:endonuclease III